MQASGASDLPPEEKGRTPDRCLEVNRSIGKVPGKGDRQKVEIFCRLCTAGGDEKIAVDLRPDLHGLNETELEVSVQVVCW